LTGPELGQKIINLNESRTLGKFSSTGLNLASS
jgi:hypothetical protein